MKSKYVVHRSFTLFRSQVMLTDHHPTPKSHLTVDDFQEPKTRPRIISNHYHFNEFNESSDRDPNSDVAEIETVL